MLYDQTWAILHIVSIVVAAIFLAAAVYKPLFARKLYAGLFAYATLVNAAVAFYAPESYIDNARFVLLESYRSFILGWFTEHVSLVVGAIAFCQFLITVGLVAGGLRARLALVGAMVFFLAIAPLGVASAFPSSLIWAFGAAWLLLAPTAKKCLKESLPKLALRQQHA